MTAYKGFLYSRFGEITAGFLGVGSFYAPTLGEFLSGHANVCPARSRLRSPSWRNGIAEREGQTFGAKPSFLQGRCPEH
jgi:hypothetical protein